MVWGVIHISKTDLIMFTYTNYFTKTNKFNHVIKCMVLIFISTLIHENIYSQNYHEWIGTTGNWDDPSNWDTGEVPVNGDDIYIGNGGTVLVNGSSRSVYSVTLEDGNIAGDQEISMHEFYWYGGNINGTGLFEITQYMEVDYGGSYTIDGRTLMSRGDCFWFNGNINISASGTFSVTDGALFSAEHGGSYSIGDGGGKFVLDADGQFENTFSSNTSIAGQMEVSTGQLIISSGNVTFSSGGTHDLTECTINIGALGKMALNSGVVNFGTMTDVFGSGWVEIAGGILNFNGNNTIFSQVDFSSGEMGGTSDGSLKSTFNWTGGQITTAATISTTLITISSGSNKTIVSGTLLLNSTGTWSEGDLLINAGATYETSPGTSFSITHSGPQALGGSAGGFINFGGLVTKTGSSTTQMESTLTVTSNGSLKVNGGIFKTEGSSTGSYNGSISIGSGAILEMGGGTHDINVGSVSGGGVFIVSDGTVSFAAGTKLITAMEISGGSTSSAANLNPNAYDQSGGVFTSTGVTNVTGNMIWSSGSILGAGDMTVVGTSTWTAGTRTLESKTMMLEGNTDWQEGDFTFNNNGKINIAATATLSINHTGYQCITGLGAFQIDGILEKYELASTTDINVSFIHNGMAKGDGTVNFGSLTNNGTVAPGISSLGQLNVNDFDNTNATLEIEINSTGAPGIDFDQLVITGTGTFNGVLDVTLLNNFIPEVGDEFHIVDCANCSSTFSTINIPVLPSGPAMGF